MGWRASDEYADTERFAFFDCVCVVDSDVSSDLVVEANFFVRPVVVSGELDSVHSQVGFEDSGIERVFGVDLGEKHKGSAVVRPTLDLWELVYCGFVG